MTGRRIVAVAVIAVTLAAAAPAAGAASRFAGQVEIDGGRSLHMECRGSGGPTVILEAGLRSRGDFWSTKIDAGQPLTVFGKVAKLTRVCEYDRPGTTLGLDGFSRSDPVAMPRTAADTVADLHAVIRAAPIRGPLILVGHSTGGLIVRLYASEYPRHVAGVVQVDALNEWIKPAMTPEDWAAYDALNVDPPPGLEGYPDLETIDFDRSFEQMGRAQRRRRLGAVDDARHWTAAKSGHYVMFEQPRIIVRAIRRVLRG